MLENKRKVLVRGSLISLIFLASTSVFATNGMKLSSYGVRYGGMGGAGLALGGSAMDVEANPSQLARHDGSQFELGLNYIRPTFIYEDEFMPYPGASATNQNGTSNEYYRNKVRNDDEVMVGIPGFPLPYVGFRKKIGENQGFGLAMYAEGGGGAKYDGILRHTPGRGTINQVAQNMMGSMLTGAVMPPLPILGDQKLISQNLRSFMAYVRVTPGYAIKMGKLSLGAGVDFGVSKMEWSWTFADPGNLMKLMGAGFEYESDIAYALSGKAGLTYDVSDNFAVAYSYQSRAKLRFDGDMSINYGNPVFWRKPQVSMNMIWPESHNVGFAYKVTEALTMAFDVSYIMWSSAINTVEFNLDSPYFKMPFGNYVQGMAFHMKWRDQPVYKLGFEYKPDKVAYRIGHNYGRSPVTEEGINPLFPVVTEHHTTLGMGIDVSEKLTIDFALEYAHRNTVKGSMMSDWSMFHTMAVLQNCDVGLAAGSCDFAQANGTFLPNYESFTYGALYNYSVTAYQVNPQFAITYKM